MFYLFCFENRIIVNKKTIVSIFSSVTFFNSSGFRQFIHASFQFTISRINDVRLLQAAAAAAASGFGGGGGSGDIEGEIFDDLFADDYNLDAGVGMGSGASGGANANNLGGASAGGASASLTGVHSALSRWGEEARVLDGDSVHDCLTG